MGVCAGGMGIGPPSRATRKPALAAKFRGIDPTETNGRSKVKKSEKFLAGGYSPQCCIVRETFRATAKTSD